MSAPLARAAAANTHFWMPSVPLQLRRADGGLLTLDGSRCVVMGIVNLTPDSFSDGGQLTDGDAGTLVDAALARVQALIAEGAELIDIGAESTRPGALLLSAGQEWARLEPLLHALGKLRPKAVLSLDTRHPFSARKAAEAGFGLLNLTFPQHFRMPIVPSEAVASNEGGTQNRARQQPWTEVDLAEQALSQAERTAILGLFDGIVVMHARGLPSTMRQHTDYVSDLCDTICSELSQTMIDLCAEMPSLMQRVLLDPGLGFAKTAEQSLALLGQVARLRRQLQRPLLIGASRKSLLGLATGLAVEQRMIPSVAAALLAAQQGAEVVRVHDVAATCAALQVQHSVRAAVSGQRGGG